ncbi:hypothetical protein J6590_014705 [Homalodisca vitripennis]|nr:hypothetical protein J6590_014705 [Homalodisca vitripennis]
MLPQVAALLEGQKAPRLHACACGRSYRHLSSLLKHRRLECGQPPRYQCHFCTARFKHSHRLKSHISTRHTAVKIL